MVLNEFHHDIDPHEQLSIGVGIGVHTIVNSFILPPIIGNVHIIAVIAIDDQFIAGVG